MINNTIEEKIKKVADDCDPQHLVSTLTAEEINKLKPKDFVKYFTDFHAQMGMLRRQMAMHERERLSLNYDKVPKDIAYLTKNEA